MKLFSRRLRPGTDLRERVAALEDYVEYLRKEGEYGTDQLTRRMDALERERSDR